MHCPKPCFCSKWLWTFYSFKAWAIYILRHSQVILNLALKHTHCTVSSVYLKPLENPGKIQDFVIWSHISVCLQCRRSLCLVSYNCLRLFVLRTRSGFSLVNLRFLRWNMQLVWMRCAAFCTSHWPPTLRTGVELSSHTNAKLSVIFRRFSTKLVLYVNLTF